MHSFTSINFVILVICAIRAVNMNDQETGSPNKRVKEDCERLLAAYMDCEQKHKLDARVSTACLSTLGTACVILPDVVLPGMHGPYCNHVLAR